MLVSHKWDGPEASESFASTRSYFETNKHVHIHVYANIALSNLEAWVRSITTTYANISNILLYKCIRGSENVLIPFSGCRTTLVARLFTDTKFSIISGIQVQKCSKILTGGAIR